MKKIILVSFILTMSAWAQKDKVDIQAQKQEQTKNMELSNQDIFTERISSPHTFGDNGFITEVEVSLNRNFSEYLTHTLDREQIERVNFEN